MFKVKFGRSLVGLHSLIFAYDDVVVLITPPLPRDGGTARTAVQVHAVNLVEIRPGERWQPISNQS